MTVSLRVLRIFPLVSMAILLAACPAQTGTPTSGPMPSPASTPAIGATVTPGLSPTVIVPSTPSAVPEGGAEVYFGDVRFAVAVADTADLRRQGLSGHPGLADDEGMWFDFGQQVSTSFWMKDMLFPLDMVWIDQNFMVVDVTHNVPAPRQGTPDSDLPHYDPGVPIRYVLEINAGLAERYGIKQGMEARIEER